MTDLATAAEDWPKGRTWDLWRGNALVSTVPDLLWALGVDKKPPADQRAAVERFIQLPAWRPAPPALRHAVVAWLAVTAV